MFSEFDRKPPLYIDLMMISFKTSEQNMYNALQFKVGNCIDKYDT